MQHIRKRCENSGGVPDRLNPVGPFPGESPRCRLAFVQGRFVCDNCVHSAIRACRFGLSAYLEPVAKAQIEHFYPKNGNGVAWIISQSRTPRTAFSKCVSPTSRTGGVEKTEPIHFEPQFLKGRHYTVSQLYTPSELHLPLRKREHQSCGHAEARSEQAPPHHP